ncbi:LLM class flavin-dependent oxidoreductase [Microbulbifer sp. MLAF003]|uniref:LLM class flavin-dependent oxidoreductase n=1 Tax=Microbulbifer sp. MLAF003 TaxID=3032582 RepID=UPI0024AD5C68|nr:LLM class flavin-dependent oxidoreductase [Microbulbifer sp. MLAF003]WHI49281.1 LLM class flavin-dependent oxidoreductase [Microbulbifer sp. MLAF003]
MLDHITPVQFVEKLGFSTIWVRIAKAAASIDQISGGRLILGIANGDRPEEYPAMNVSYQERGKLFRENYKYIRRVAEPSPNFKAPLGQFLEIWTYCPNQKKQSCLY